MSYLVMDHNKDIFSYYLNDGQKMYVSFHDDDVGLKAFITNKEGTEVLVELNQMEALKVWKNLDKYFGKK